MAHHPAVLCMTAGNVVGSIPVLPGWFESILQLVKKMKRMFGNRGQIILSSHWGKAGATNQEQHVKWEEEAGSGA